MVVLPRPEFGAPPLCDLSLPVCHMGQGSTWEGSREAGGAGRKWAGTRNCCCWRVPSERSTAPAMLPARRGDAEMNKSLVTLKGGMQTEWRGRIHHRGVHCVQPGAGTQQGRGTRPWGPQSLKVC